MIKAVGPFDVYRETIGKLAGNGIILLAGDPPNPMTIGWGTIGEIWHYANIHGTGPPHPLHFHSYGERKRFHGLRIARQL